MLSIIICSRAQTINENLSVNLENTVGCLYELIVVDNSENKYSIFEAYNIGIQKAKGAYWCFMHDDISFHTPDWGMAIRAIFESDCNIGLIGVAGAKVKTKMPSAWWECPIDQRVINIIQHIDGGTIEKWELGWGKKSIEEVAAIDGVFMVGRSVVGLRFDEMKLKGFHNYDLNLSLAYKKQGYKIMVTHNVLLEHFSAGVINEDWLVSVLNFDRYYGKYLPIDINNCRV
ncbi:glycosyltransferase, partial [Flavobacterium sp. ACAM 123]|uniref:glycosyltransferase n=1 Tax=Flavobacterium sp. ACAM 123 TaxID=1189620 RepID=UPI00036F51C0